MLPDQPRRLRRLGQAAITLATLALARRSCADPQASVALTAAAGDVSLEGRHVGAFHLGARADLLFLRSRDGTMGVGPFVELGTDAFESASLAGGIDWLVPLLPDLPFVVSGGAFDRENAGVSQRGALGEIYWGTRPYNFNAPYEIAFGLFVETTYALTPERETDVLAGVAVDLSLLAYPFLLAYGAIAR